MTGEPADWVLSQKKVFTNWVNLYLGKRDMQVKELAAHIARVTASLESLVSQLERDKAIGYAMKSSVQLQQYLGAEAEKLVTESEEGVNGSPGGIGLAAGKKKKSNFVPSADDISALLDEFRNMEYVENEDTIPQDMPQNNSTLLLVHAIHHAAQQALFSGKISKSISSLLQGIPPESDFIPQIKHEAERRYKDMQGWVGEWVASLGKLAGLVTARTGTIVSSYMQFQKEYESLRKQHQDIKDKLDFLGNEQKVNEDDDLPPEKVIPIISLDIEEEIPKKLPNTPPLSKKQIKGSLSPITRKNSPTAKTPPPLTKTPPPTSKPLASSPKALPLRASAKPVPKERKEKKAGEKAGAQGEKSEKNEKTQTTPKTPASPAKSTPPQKFAGASVEVDKHLTEILTKLQVTGPITKIGDCQYQIGSKKVTMQIISGYLVVRVGGGFMKFEEWILKYGRKEGLLIAGEPISGVGAVTLGAHGTMSVKPMSKEK